MNPILASLLPPTTPAAPVVVLRKQPAPVPNPAEIALKVLNREELLVKEIRPRDPQVDPSHFVHKVQHMNFSRSILSPPSYNFDPLGSSQPNTHARNF